MRNHFLLYLDVLGFSDLVSDAEKVLKLYRIIDSLNVHRHPGFHAIVFSDTLLVYNTAELEDVEDARFAVTILCEFAQDLLYRTVGRGYSFRALLTYGQFHHERMKNLEAFFGPALVSAYRKERDIKCVGLFVDDCCLPLMIGFKTRPFGAGYSFVYMTLGFTDLYPEPEDIFFPGAPTGPPPLPYPPSCIEGTDAEYNLIFEVRHLEEVHRHMREHPLSEVRAKYLAAWSMYEQQYPELTRVLADAAFSLDALSPIDWSDAERHFRDESAI